MYNICLKDILFTDWHFYLEIIKQKLEINFYNEAENFWLSVKQGSIKYHFLSLWYDSTWDWRPVFRVIGEHSDHYIYIYIYIYMYLPIHLHEQEATQSQFLSGV